MAVRVCATPGCTGCEKIGGLCSKCDSEKNGSLYLGAETTEFRQQQVRKPKQKAAYASAVARRRQE